MLSMDDFHSRDVLEEIMSVKIKDEYELIAKRCPACQSLVLARVQKDHFGAIHYSEYKCSSCDWMSPINEKIREAV